MSAQEPWLRDQEDRAAIAHGLLESEFEIWFDQEIGPVLKTPYLDGREQIDPPYVRLCIRDVARLAFRQGLAIGREGRA